MLFCPTRNSIFLPYFLLNDHFYHNFRYLLSFCLRHKCGFCHSIFLSTSKYYELSEQLQLSFWIMYIAELIRNGSHIKHWCQRTGYTCEWSLLLILLGWWKPLLTSTLRSSLRTNTTSHFFPRICSIWIIPKKRLICMHYLKNLLP